ncbi:MAG TPA: DUF4337 family protein [Gemmataceae bacterium]|nr:DUF4337 family protein [Gemmataceae bacterium]
MSQAPAAAPKPAEPEKPRTVWDRVVTSTPIILTVIATVLAGKSAGEMTQAQYHRAVAAQYQSKVSDQWNFFQAKRIRGTDMEGTAILLRSSTGAGKLSPDSLKASAKRLSEYFKRAEKEADALVKVVGAAGSATDVTAPAERFRGETKKALAASVKVVEKLDALAKESPNSPLSYLAEGKVPERAQLASDQRDELTKALEAIKPDVRKSLSYFDAGLLKTLYDLNPAIPEAVWEVNERKTERQMDDTLPKINEEQIHKAIEDAEEAARQFEAACAPITGAFRDLDKLIVDQTGAARAVYRASQEVSLAAGPLSGGDSKLNELHQAAQAAERAGLILKAAADELGNDFKAAQLVYDSRRYDREARDNQAVAGLYELDVRKASLESDRHRERSTHLFYAMLAAQAGVTIATFSLAVRYRSVLWGLAALAGLGALGIGAFVLLTR